MSERHSGAHDLAHSDAPSLGRKFIATSRPAHALEDFGVQALEECLQVTRGQFMTQPKLWLQPEPSANADADIDNVRRSPESLRRDNKFISYLLRGDTGGSSNATNDTRGLHKSLMILQLP